MNLRACIATFLLFAAPAAAISACGNGTVNAYCEEKCDCLRCNDDDLAACKAAEAGQLKAASKYDCKQEYEDLLACLTDEGKCERQGSVRFFSSGDDCFDEADDYNDCVEDASNLDIGDADDAVDGSGSTGSGGGTDNVTACNNFVDSITCGDVSMYIDCSQYSTYPCDISAYFNCLASNTICSDGIIDNTGWGACAAEATCQ